MAIHAAAAELPLIYRAHHDPITVRPVGIVATVSVAAPTPISEQPRPTRFAIGCWVGPMLSSPAARLVVGNARQPEVRIGKAGGANLHQVVKAGLGGAWIAS